MVGPVEGRIEVTPAAIATVASEAALSCYGVVGTADKDLVAGIAQVLTRDRKRGISVQVHDGQIEIDVYVIIEYGTRIATVARSVMEVVQFRVEQALGIPIGEVNVHVVGLRISNVD